MNIKETIIKSEKKSSLILLVVPIILTLFLYHGNHGVFEKQFTSLSSYFFFDLYSHMYEYLAAFVLLFLIPVVFIKYILKGRLGNYGIALGDVKLGLKFTVISILVLIPFLIAGTIMPGMKETYPGARSTIGNLGPFIVIECFYLLYYIGWEFFFRGFMLFGLREKFGDLAAILIQTIPSCIMHAGKPEAEIVGSIIAGLAFGYLAIRTRSILYPLLIHGFIGIFTDSLIAMQLR